jgi:hypothetical protein
MTIMELGAVGELVGGVAVIGSLIYVGLQVRQSNQLTRVQALSTRLSGQREADISLIGNDGADALAKAVDRPEELTTAETIRCYNYLATVLASFQHSFEAYELGLLSRRDWEAARSGIAIYLDFPFGHAWWSEARTSVFPDRFIEEVNQALVASPESTTAQFDRIRRKARQLTAGVQR